MPKSIQTEKISMNTAKANLTTMMMCSSSSKIENIAYKYRMSRQDDYYCSFC